MKHSRIVKNTWTVAPGTSRGSRWTGAVWQPTWTSSSKLPCQTTRRGRLIPDSSSSCSSFPACVHVVVSSGMQCMAHLFILTCDARVGLGGEQRLPFVTVNDRWRKHAGLSSMLVAFQQAKWKKYLGTVYCNVHRLQSNFLIRLLGGTAACFGM